MGFMFEWSTSPWLLAGLALIAGFASSDQSLAQSDGSVEATYARECPQHQDAQLCNNLRTALPKGSPPSRIAEKDPVWGAIPMIDGAWWAGRSEVWIGQKKSVRENGLLNNGLREWQTITTYDLYGNVKEAITVKTTKTARVLRSATTFPERWSPVQVLADGSVYFEKYKHALVMVDADGFDWLPGTLAGGEFKLDPQFSSPASGRFTRLGPPQDQQFVDRVNNALNARLRQQAQQKAESRAAFGQLLATGVAAYGVAATGGDMSAVPLNGNALEILQGGAAETSRQQQITQSRFDTTMASAQHSERPSSATGDIESDPRAATAPAVASAPVAASAKGKTMFGWCYAAQTSAGDSPIYHSQVGRIDNYLNGGTTSSPNDSWIHRMESEFGGRIGAYVSLICYENTSASGFDYNRRTNAQTSRQIIDVPWAPH